jgi:glycosyltransferase involved in cell wall biosynthesis
LRPGQFPDEEEAEGMKYSNITTANTEFILISFEGPDGYSMAGGLGVRMHNLSRTLAETGFNTHLFFIGDPKLPGEEKLEQGRLILHRWCQWISLHHPAGVYDGEEGKLADFNNSLPGFVMEKIIRPAVVENKLVVILGEEWQTVEVMCRLSEALSQAGLRDKAILFWNANNTFSFHRVNWGRLNYSTTITTISRYMKHIMERMGLTPLVIPNGIPRSLFKDIDTDLINHLRGTFGADILLCKVARWDPDKNWMEAVEAVARLKKLGIKTTLLARGGMEPYGREVINHAVSLGLSVKEARVSESDQDGYLQALAAAAPADIIDIRFQIPLDFLAVMYRGADAVLANSSHEPFGIVGLEVMAAGGIVFTGSTGEDYSISFVNSFMIETPDPMEIVSYVMYIKSYPEQAERMRDLARFMARYYTWEASVQNLIGKLENQGRIQGTLENSFTAQQSPIPPAEQVAAARASGIPGKIEDLNGPVKSRCLS